MNITITPEQIGGHLATCPDKERAKILYQVISTILVRDIDPFAGGKRCANSRTKKDGEMIARILSDFVGGMSAEAEVEK